MTRKQKNRKKRGKSTTSSGDTCYTYPFNSIDVLDLPTRVINALKREKINNISDLLILGEDELRLVKKPGRGGYKIHYGTYQRYLFS
jgi:DNA-directed RNA polymerase alpha subunit